MIEEAARMDLSHPDSQPDRKLNELIWKPVKGANSRMPTPIYAGSPGDHGDD